MPLTRSQRLVLARIITSERVQLGSGHLWDGKVCIIAWAEALELRGQGLIRIDSSSGEIALTERGRSLAEALILELSTS